MGQEPQSLGGFWSGTPPGKHAASLPWRGRYPSLPERRCPNLSWWGLRDTTSSHPSTRGFCFSYPGSSLGFTHHGREVPLHVSKSQKTRSFLQTPPHHLMPQFHIPSNALVYNSREVQSARPRGHGKKQHFKDRNSFPPPSLSEELFFCSTFLRIRAHCISPFPNRHMQRKSLWQWRCQVAWATLISAIPSCYLQRYSLRPTLLYQETHFKAIHTQGYLRLPNISEACSDIVKSLNKQKGQILCCSFSPTKC